MVNYNPTWSQERRSQWFAETFATLPTEAERQAVLDNLRNRSSRYTRNNRNILNADINTYLEFLGNASIAINEGLNVEVVNDAEADADLDGVLEADEVLLAVSREPIVQDITRQAQIPSTPSNLKLIAFFLVNYIFFFVTHMNDDQYIDKVSKIFSVSPDTVRVAISGGNSKNYYMFAQDCYNPRSRDFVWRLIVGPLHEARDRIAFQRDSIYMFIYNIIYTLYRSYVLYNAVRTVP